MIDNFGKIENAMEVAGGGKGERAWVKRWRSAGSKAIIWGFGLHKTDKTPCALID